MSADYGNAADYGTAADCQDRRLRPGNSLGALGSATL